MSRAEKFAYGFCILLASAALSWCSYDQMQDEQQSADAASNTRHIAKLDAAERKREATLQALAAQGDQVATQAWSDK